MKIRKSSNLKILSGELKGRAIHAPVSATTHPMGSRERLALINSLRSEVPGARVLDMYAGTGAIGLEMLSNGAREAVFVDKQPRAMEVIRENLRICEAETQAKVLKSLDEVQGEFDLVIADPPYSLYMNEMPNLKRLTGYLKNGGRMVLSHPREFNSRVLPALVNLSLAPGLLPLQYEKTVNYAACYLTFYRR